MKKILPMAAAILCGLFVLADFFVPHPSIGSVAAVLVEGATILATFALFLGVLNLLSVHGRRVVKEARGRGLGVVLIASLLATLAIGVASPGSMALSWIFDYMYYPLQATMAALLAFFVVSAAYRAFRLRNAQAAIMLVSSLLVILTQLPFGQAISPYLPIARDWLLTVPVTAGMRGIVLGAALGTMATALRILLTVDRPYV